MIDHWGLGGAQRALADFIRHDQAHQHGIASLFRHHAQAWDVGNDVPLWFLAKSYRGSLAACYRLRRLIRQWSPDVIQIHLNGARFITAFALLGFRQRPMIIWHEHSGKELKALYGRLWGYLLMVWQKRLMKRVAFIVGNSKSTMTYIAKHLEVPQDQQRLIHCLVDTEQIQALAQLPLEAMPEAAKPGGKVVGFVGRLASQKGPDELVAVAKALKETSPATQLWIVGDGPSREPIQKAVVSLGFQAQTVFWGVRQDVYAVMKQMDVLVMPSRYEPFGLVAMEAFVLGKSVVAYGVDGLAEVMEISPLGHKVAPGDRATFIDQLLTVLAQEPPAALALKSHPFEPAVICGAWDQLYQEVTSKD